MFAYQTDLLPISYICHTSLLDLHHITTLGDHFDPHMATSKKGQVIGSSSRSTIARDGSSHDDGPSRAVVSQINRKPPSERSSRCVPTLARAPCELVQRSCQHDRKAHCEKRLWRLDPPQASPPAARLTGCSSVLIRLSHPACQESFSENAGNDAQPTAG